MPEQGYEESEIFLLQWTPVYEYEPKTIQGVNSEEPPVKFLRLRLPNVNLEFRIVPTHAATSTTIVYRVLARHGEEKPWIVGSYPSVEEAKFRVLDQIVYFKLFINGTMDLRKPLR